MSSNPAAGSDSCIEWTSASKTSLKSMTAERSTGVFDTRAIE